MPSYAKEDFRPDSKTELITPELASEILEVNNRNRPMSQRTVDRYASDMENGRWKLNGESIIIASNGELIDGQHRLWAIVECGIAVPMVVVRGVDPEAFSTVDTGRGRTFGHVLGVRKEHYANQLATAVRSVWQYRKSGSLVLKEKPTHEELAECLVSEPPDIRDSLTFCINNKQAGIMTPAFAAFFHHIFAQVDRGDADSFIQSLYSGANLEPSSAILLLRNKLVDDKASRKSLHKSAVAWLVFRTWNIVRQKRTVSCLRLPGRDTKLTLPKLV